MKKISYENWARKIIDEFEFTTCGFVCEQDCDELNDCHSCINCIHFLSGSCDAALEAYVNEVG